ncbi:cation transporting ATPase C-terminal domain-containing protein [Synechococcus sp. RSCCF101]|uniref:cation transporting ATPase C-terminal domain-containing protein n=1 Tax=Synechococcus sp. RSCCF101 TaxID=2511069 RepID=UPI00351A181E
MVVAVALQVLFSQLPAMNHWFATTPLSPDDWLICSLAMLPMLPMAWLTHRLDRPAGAA